MQLSGLSKLLRKVDWHPPTLLRYGTLYHTLPTLRLYINTYRVAQKARLLETVRQNGVT